MLRSPELSETDIYRDVLEYDMKAMLINGSPRKNGNTSELVRIFNDRIEDKVDIDTISIFEMDIKGCTNCGACQKNVLVSHCTVKDDMSSLYDMFIGSDLIILASPIYMWQMTPCTLAFLNRLHCLCQSSDFKYNEMAGKKMILLLTMGAEKEVADFAVNGMKEFCEFFSIDYLGDVRAEFAD